MQINTSVLQRVGVRATVADTYTPYLNEAMAQYDITDVNEVCAFLSQALHESDRLAHLEEGLSYSSADRIKLVFRRLRVLPDAQIRALVKNPVGLANAAYAGVNGNTLPDDGWRYRGRGCFQLTGRANYQSASASIGKDYVTYPDLVSRPEGACLTAAWFWVSQGAQVKARQGDYLGCTRLINGSAMLGKQEREALRLALLQAVK